MATEPEENVRRHEKLSIASPVKFGFAFALRQFLFLLCLALVSMPLAIFFRSFVTTVLKGGLAAG